MIDPVVCDRATVPKWQSSIAVFKYVPDDEYQLYPDVNVTYLKVTATITGYQALDDEIQGEIDWDGVDITTIEGLTDLLNAYYPCTGAILQVVVGPPGRRPNLPRNRYPYFIEFEPKKRELYEMATDTKEKQSRSMETVNLTKSAGTAQSMEIMDIDMGGGGFGAQGSYAGTGGGFTYTAPSGQWGTKSLNSGQSQVDRSVESGTEKRETYSFTTQLSQMYHLLDSYHLGTNRAVFFVQPRPHVLEEPSGFVRGPRKVEGIQEFFLVVGQPKDQEEPFCVSVRLDTAHLIETDVLEYEYRTDISDLATATARIASRNDQPDGTTTRRACFIFDCWDVTYQCFRTNAIDEQVYTAPDGFVIESYNVLVNDTDHGSTSVAIAPGNKTLTVHAEANGHICYEASGVCLDCPDEVDKWSGYARCQVQVNLRSEVPTVKVGTDLRLLITTRGLCCCPEQELDLGDIIIIDEVDIPVAIGGRHTYGPAVMTTQRETPGMARATYQRDVTSVSQTQEDDCGCGPKAMRRSVNAPDGGERQMSIRQANGMSEWINNRMVQSFSLQRPGLIPKRFVETDVFSRQLSSLLRRSRAGRARLQENVAEQLPKELLAAVSQITGKPPQEIVANDLLFVRPRDLERLSGIDPRQIARLKIPLLGIPLREKRPEADDNTYHDDQAK